MVRFYSITPEEYRKNGFGLRIHFGFHPTPFGESLIAVTGRRICALGLMDRRKKQEAVKEMKQEWERASFRESPGITQPIADMVFFPPAKKVKPRIDLFVKGTPFQIRVWKALLRIPYGSVASYQEIAKKAGLPLAARAVGNAIARNPIAFLIPCHRVIRKSGDLGKYRWGAEKKKEILLRENRSLHF